MVLAERAPEIFARAATRARTCSSCTTCATAGASGSRPSCTSTGRPASRPSTRADEPLVARMLEAFERAHRRARRRQHVASTRPAGRWSTTRATRSSASARRRSTCWPSGRSSSAARPPAARAARRTRRRAVSAPALRRRHPDRRAARRSARCSTRSPRPTGRARTRDRRRRPAGGRPGAALGGAARWRAGARAAPAARGPAAARNAGWRASRAPWVAFLDDDVRAAAAAGAPSSAPTSPAWPRDVGGIAGPGRACPLPADRRPTDWERNVAGLRGRARGRRPTWPTGATALDAVGGFDERFPRAYREDADLGAARRRARAGGSCAGAARVAHPVGPAPTAGSRCASRPATPTTRSCAALHGRGWRERAGAPRGPAAAPPGHARRRRCWRVAAAPSAAGAVAGVARRPPGLAADRRAGVGAHRARARATRARGGRRWSSTSAAHAARRDGAGGCARPRARLRAPRWPGRVARRRPGAVLLDRDGTLVVDVPYNGDPARVRADAGRARGARPRCARAGVRVGVVSNQSGIARGLLTRRARCDAVNARIEELLGPLGAWLGLPARARRRLRLPQARARPRAAGGRRAGRRRPSAARWSATSAPTSRPRAPPAPGRSSCRRRAHAARGGRGRPRGRAATCARRAVDARLPAGARPTVSARRVLVARLDNDGRRAARRPGRPRASPRAPTGSRCCAARAGAQAARAAARASTRCSSGARRGSTRSRRPSTAEDVARARRRGSPRARVDRRADLRLLPPEPAADGAAAAAGRRAVDRRDVSVDYPGSLLDLRHRIDDDVHEVERALDLARAAGFALPPGDDGRCAVRGAGRALRSAGAATSSCIPGASVPARAWSPERNAALVEALAAAGRSGARHRRARRSARSPRCVAGRPRGRRPRRPDDARRAGRGARAAPTRVVVGNTGPGAPRGGGRHAGRLALRPDRAGGALAAVAASRTSCCSSTCPCAGCRARGLPGAGPSRAWRASAPDDVARRRRARSHRTGGAPHEDPALARPRLVDDGLRPGRARVRRAGRCPTAARTARGRAQTWDWPRHGRRGAARRSCATSDVDVVVLQRPHELEHLREGGSAAAPGRDVPAIYVEHNAPQGRIAEMRHPAADRDDLPLVPRHALQRAVLGRRAHADARDRARHRRSGPALHGRAAARRRGHQRGAPARRG